MTRCPVIDEFMEKVLSKGKMAWDAEIESREAVILNSKADPGIELARAYICADWAVRTVFADALKKAGCIKTSNRIKKLDAGNSPTGMRALENAIKWFAEGPTMSKLDADEQGGLNQEYREMLMEVGYQARAAVCMARMSNDGIGNDVDRTYHFGRLAEHVVNALDRSGISEISPGGLIDSMIGKKSSVMARMR